MQQYTLGAGLAAKIFYDEMDATLDALDPRSPLIVLNGLLSGTFSPTLKRSIGLAYVATEHAQVGQAIEIEIRGRASEAHIVKTPFYPVRNKI